MEKKISNEGRLLNSRASQFYSWDDVDIPIKTQGPCDASWAFAAIASLEYRYKRFFHQSFSLSEQELIDCVFPERENMGCGYSLVNDVVVESLKYIRQNGISFDMEYPYRARWGKCQANSTYRLPVKMNHHGMVPESSFANELHRYGPIIVFFHVDHSFYRYRSGIYRSKTCESFLHNHAVLLIGYGVENNIKYWLMRNSWGPQFGENGYFRIERDVSMCGLYLGFYPVMF